MLVAWQLTTTKTVVSVPRLVSEIPHAAATPQRPAACIKMRRSVFGPGLSPQYAVILGVSPAG